MEEAWAVARCDLGVSESEVWWLTPRQFAALIERHVRRERIMDHRFGTIAAVIANAHTDPDKRPEPWQPLDFFPTPEEAKAAAEGEDLPPLTVDALKADFMAAGIRVVSRSEMEKEGAAEEEEKKKKKKNDA